MGEPLAGLLVNGPSRRTLCFGEDLSSNLVGDCVEGEVDLLFAVLVVCSAKSTEEP